MKFTKDNLPKNANELEKLVQLYGLRPVGYVTHRDMKVYLADTDLEMDRPKDYPWGYYQTLWFVQSPKNDEKFDMGSWETYDSMHDKEQEWTPETKRKARHQTAVNRAAEWIDANFKVGRYGH